MASLLAIAMISGLWGLVFFATGGDRIASKGWYALPLAAVLLAVYNFGFIGASPVPELDYSMSQGTPADNAACTEALEKLSELGLVLDATNPGQLTVKGELWEQLPPNVQGGVRNCVATLQGSEAEIEVELR